MSKGWSVSMEYGVDQGMRRQVLKLADERWLVWGVQTGADNSSNNPRWTTYYMIRVRRHTEFIFLHIFFGEKLGRIHGF